MKNNPAEESTIKSNNLKSISIIASMLMEAQLILIIASTEQKCSLFFLFFFFS